MTDLFITILNMSITASIAALAVILARILLKRAPKIFSYMLWGVVLFRLVAPFSIESPFSLMPDSSNGIPQFAVYSQAPDIQVMLAGPKVSVAISANREIIILADSGNICIGNATPMETAAASIINIVRVAGYIWLAGFASLILYAAAGYVRLKRLVRYATLVRDNIFESDKVKTPFVLGLIRPKIYFPLCHAHRDYILLHEQTHIRRRDYLIKPIAYAALALHWFNPLIWVSYLLMTKDMEMSCDEAVLRRISADIRGEYSTCLLNCSVNKGSLLYPLAFGESSVKERVLNVLSFKRPKLWVSALSVMAVLVVFVGFTSNRIMAVDVEGMYSYPFQRVYSADELTAALEGFDTASPATIIIGADFALPTTVNISHPNLTIAGDATNRPTLTANGENGLTVSAGANIRIEVLALLRGTAGGSGISIQGGSVTIQNVEIAGFANSGVRFQGPEGRLEMFEGTLIHSNTADMGGGVHISGENSMFIMHGGLISGNTAVYGGGGVFLCGSGNDIVIYGGLVIGNTARILTCLY